MFDITTDDITTEVLYTSEQLRAVFEKSQRGDHILYVVGDLGNEVCSTPPGSKANEIKDLVNKLTVEGVAYATHKRLGDNKSEYYLVKR